MDCAMNNVLVTSAPFTSLLERAATDPTFSVEKLEVLLRLQMEIADKEARREFNAAMAQAQAEMLPVVRDAKNTHLGNKYASLAALDNASRPIFTRHGFAVRFGSTTPHEGVLRLICTVSHAAGHWEESHLDGPTANTGSQGGRTQTTGVQGVGSVTTYLRRYLLSLVFNITVTDDDDDGEATRPTSPSRPPPPIRPAPENVAKARPNGTEPPVRTARMFLDEMEPLFAAARTQEQIDALIGRSDVQRAMAMFTEGSGSAVRLNGMVHAAIKRIAEAEAAALNAAADASDRAEAGEEFAEESDDDTWPEVDTTGTGAA
jgi:hypothetical protein